MELRPPLVTRGKRSLQPGRLHLRLCRKSSEKSIDSHDASAPLIGPPLAVPVIVGQRTLGFGRISGHSTSRMSKAPTAWNRKTGQKNQ